MDGQRIVQKDIDRFRSKYVEGNPGACWLWTGSAPHGHAEFYSHGKRRSARRFAYWLANGNFPTGRSVVNVPPCESKLCVNPRHLGIANHPCGTACTDGEAEDAEIDATCDAISKLTLPEIESSIQTLQRRLGVLTLLRDGLKPKPVPRVEAKVRKKPKKQTYKHASKGVRETFQASTENRIVSILASREEPQMSMVDLSHALACGRESIVDAVDRSPLFVQSGEMVSLNEAGRERVIVMETSGNARPHG